MGDMLKLKKREWGFFKAEEQMRKTQRVLLWKAEECRRESGQSCVERRRMIVQGDGGLGGGSMS